MGMGPRGVMCHADLYEAVAVVDLGGMQVFVMTMMGRKITMDAKADGSDTTDNINERIESKGEIPQTLGFEGRILDSAWNLSICGIQKEAILVLSGKGVDMPVCVTTAKGQTILVDVQSSNTIDDVMLKIRVSTGTPIANIQLAAHD